ncbi:MULTISPECIES: hypothetical protein [Helicobacter]|uniref:hypothetical protein n=1 Tax=Helicobacter TaxID=209 RepID=UPI0026025346|nr:hypothetical protein [Helicobacter sp. UBA3407]
MDLFKEKMETWQGKLVRLKTDCRTGEHIYPKGFLMRIDCVSKVKVRLQTMPCATCGIVDFMTIKTQKKNYAYYFEFVEESELNNADCIPLKIELKGQRYFKQLAEVIAQIAKKESLNLESFCTKLKLSARELIRVKQ